ncbi:MAG: TatD family hydrolase [Candidatus Nitrosocaldus sp.]|nr:TatD family hydrolase [Candidatus Nitrosocaldus sp.]MDW8000535.1 TatD family hydrolase [Candidatus Nitrosocaldus sp.]
MLVDAHVHLTDREYDGMEDVVVGMLRSMDIRAVSVSMDLETAERNLVLAEKYGHIIIPFAGLHPWCVTSDGYEDTLDGICSFIEANIARIKGIGEIGLDRAIASDSSSDGFKAQVRVFETMLGIAEKHSKPVSIHSRRAVDDVISILTSYNIRGVLLHWFSGSKKQLATANGRGYYVSYGPVLVYSKDKQVLLRHTDRELVLVETDGPVRYGSCFSDRTAMPSFLASVAYAFANTLDLNYGDAEALLLGNARRYLGLNL